MMKRLGGSVLSAAALLSGSVLVAVPAAADWAGPIKTVLVWSSSATSASKLCVKSQASYDAKPGHRIVRKCYAVGPNGNGYAYRFQYRVIHPGPAPV